MEPPEQSADNLPTIPTVQAKGRITAWMASNSKAVVAGFITLILAPSLLVALQIYAKDREQARTAEIEVSKIKLAADLEQNQARQQEAREDALRQEDLERIERQQTQAQHQRLLTFYTSLLAKLNEADGVWWVRPVQDAGAALVQYDRAKLLPIYEQAQQLIDSNMDLVALNPSMSERMTEFEKRVAAYKPISALSGRPHGNLLWDLQWTVQAMNQRPRV